MGGLVVGSILTTPVGGVAFAAGGYAVTRLAGRRRERKMREQLEGEEEVVEGEEPADVATQDETQSDSQQDYEIPLNSIFYTPRHDPREDELEQKVNSRFKAEGRHHLEASRLTTTGTSTRSEGERRRRRNGRE